MPAYLNNKDFLLALHESKKSYSSFTREEYGDFDAIVHDLAEITPELIAATRAKRAATQMNDERLKQKAQGIVARKRLVTEVSGDDIDSATLVFRLMSAHHIPLDPTRKARTRSSNPTRAKINFPPFVHYIVVDGRPVEVGRSHWIGSLSNGEFSIDHGKMTRQLAMMFMNLAERYSLRANFRGYSYREEMVGAALVQLVQIGLQFDESKSSNPFAFYTSACHNVFLRILASEKKTQGIRDDLLVSAGCKPSLARQFSDEGSG